MPPVVIAVVPTVLGALYVSGAVHHVARLVFPLDDPYIHLQYARNLVTGHGFSFNPDEPSPGATSPAWVILLALGRLIAGSSEATAIVLALAAATLVLRLRHSALTGARRGLTLGLAAGIGATVRPELFLLVVIVGIAETMRAVRDTRMERCIERDHRRRRGTAPRNASLAVLPVYVLAVLVAVLPYTLFCLHTSGRPFPNTFYAKALIPAVAGTVSMPTQRAHYLPELAKILWADNPVLLLALLPGVLWAWRERRLVLVLWPLCFWIYALVLAPVLYHHARYTIPLTSALAVLAAGGLALVGRRAWIAALLAAVLLVGALPAQLRYRGAYLDDVGTTAAIQVAMGDWIANNVPANASIATQDVGAITYYGQRRCIDMIGLVSTDLITMIRATDVKRVNPLETLWSYLRERHPDYFVFFPVAFPDLAREPHLRAVHAVEHRNTTGGEDVFVAFQVVP